MSDLDLTKAFEATADELSHQLLGRPIIEMNETTQDSLRRDANRLVTAALPHIREALADEAEQKARMSDEMYKRYAGDILGVKYAIGRDIGTNRAVNVVRGSANG